MTGAAGTAEAPRLAEHGNAYNIFILVLTVFSLIVMALLILPWVDDNTKDLLLVYDNAICVIFLVDFAINMRGAKPKRAYFIDRRGWLDLIGSIPTLGVFKLGALLRLARLSRLARVSKLLRGNNKKMLIADVLQNRGQYAAFITILSAGLVLSVASIAMLQFEDRAGAAANITTGGDSLWWAIVTITTVGYGDYYPVTTLGRATAVFVMLAGVGIIGALASILASILVPPPKEKSVEEVAAEAAADAAEKAADVADVKSTEHIVAELAAIRAELSALRAAVTGTSTDPPPTG
jgi:voltage-gated potassium channel